MDVQQHDFWYHFGYIWACIQERWPIFIGRKKKTLMTRWMTGIMKQVNTYHCKSVTETQISQFSLLTNRLPWQRIHLYKLSNHQSKPDMFLLLHLPIISLPLHLPPTPLKLYRSAVYWLWPDVQGGQGHSAWVRIIWNWWWKFRSQPSLEVSSFQLSRSITPCLFSLPLPPLSFLLPLSFCPSSSSSNHTWLLH